MYCTVGSEWLNSEFQMIFTYDLNFGCFVIILARYNHVWNLEESNLIHFSLNSGLKFQNLGISLQKFTKIVKTQSHGFSLSFSNFWQLWHLGKWDQMRNCATKRNILKYSHLRMWFLLLWSLDVESWIFKNVVKTGQFLKVFSSNFFYFYHFPYPN